MYYLGLGVSQDYVQAYKWFYLSGSGSSPASRAKANQVLDDLAGKMTPQQVAEAQELAREWRSNLK
jgi:TPR repeat protein